MLDFFSIFILHTNSMGVIFLFINVYFFFPSNQRRNKLFVRMRFNICTDNSIKFKFKFLNSKSFTKENLGLIKPK